jgi:hypothetical protein
MAEPAFVVQHFLTCTSASPNPGNLPNVAYNLANVSYTYRLPATVARAARIRAFALYARFIRTDGTDGIVPFSFDMVHIDHRGTEQLVARGTLDPVDFPAGHPVINVVWKVSDLAIPGRGLYEIRLAGGTARRPLASEYLRFE